MNDYGLQIKNISNNVLISNATAQIAFYSKIPYTSAVYKSQLYSFPNYDKPTPMTPVIFIEYTFECTDIPIIFIRPRGFMHLTTANIIYFNGRYAITSQTNNGNTWVVTMMIKTLTDAVNTYGDSIPQGVPLSLSDINRLALVPDLFIFTNTNKAPFMSTEPYGLQVRDYNNDVCFDSRKKSLVITGTYHDDLKMGSHFSMDSNNDYSYGLATEGDTRKLKTPNDNTTNWQTNRIVYEKSGAPWKDNTLWDIGLNSNSNLQPIQLNLKIPPLYTPGKSSSDYVGNIQTTLYNSVMFHAPVLAQAYYEYTKKGYKKSCSWTGSCQEHWSTAKWGVVSRLCVGISHLYTYTFPLAFNENTGDFSQSGLYIGQMDNRQLHLFDYLYIQSAYAPYKLMYSFVATSEGNSWYAGGGGGSNISTGTPPYPAQMINTQGYNIIFSDARIYE